jgi:hypothetical protein
MASRKPSVLALALAALVVVPLAGQDSPFGIQGLGTPGRFESARARATGGSFAVFDPFSVLAEAALAGMPRLTATATGAASYLTDDIGSLNDSRRGSRFPLFQIGGPAWSHVVLAAGFSTYLDRTYHVVIRDTVTLGGSSQAITDDLSADGGVTDIRFVAARQFGRLALGAGFHLLAGSSRFQFVRTFEDTSIYADVSQGGEVAYRGSGASASAILTVGRQLQLAGFYRTDTRLRSEESGKTVARNNLPTTVGGALRLQLVPQATLAAALVRRSWGTALDSNAYNTTSWSGGAEFGRRLPLRVGVRGGDLPFGPGGRAPREFAFAFGTGRIFADGRGIIDVALERLRRTGGGLTETGWTALLTVAVRP